VLALDALRALDGVRGLELLEREVRFMLQGVRHAALLRISARLEQTLEAARAWLTTNSNDMSGIEAGARRFALTAGRTFALALLARQAQWSLDHEQDGRSLAAARRFAAHGMNLMAQMDAGDSRMLARDEAR
jgi:hypothetical protein